VCAEGQENVERATIAEVDENWQAVCDTEQTLEVDTICLAVGLSPLAELAWMAGCQFTFVPSLGGWVPVHDQDMRTNLEGLYVAGDIAGIEEASTAMEEGRLAGLAAAEALGYLSPEISAQKKTQVHDRLAALRCGGFGEVRATAKNHIIEASCEA
jgi:thioredoxin reductase